MILQVCANQLSEYKFNVLNKVSEQTYIESNIDLGTVTTATLILNRVNDTEKYSIDISSTFQYLRTDGGLTVNFSDFGLDEIYGQTFFPDWMWEITIEYVYDENEYSTSVTVGFLKIIKNIVYQQMIKSNWKKELACSCGCESDNTTIRKWSYLMELEVTAELCLINEYMKILRALYKLTGTDHEFEGS